MDISGRENAGQKSSNHENVHAAARSALQKAAQVTGLLATLIVANASAQPCPRPSPPSAVAITYHGEISGCDSDNTLPCLIGEQIVFRGITMNYDSSVACDMFNFAWFAEWGNYVGNLPNLSAPSGLVAAYRWARLGTFFVSFRYEKGGQANYVQTYTYITIGPGTPQRRRSARH